MTRADRSARNKAAWAAMRWRDRARYLYQKRRLRRKLDSHRATSTPGDILLTVQPVIKFRGTIDLRAL